MSELIEQVLKNRFKQLNEPELIKEISEVGMLHSCTRDEEIIKPGAYIKFVPLIVYGTLRIMRVDEQGRDVYLYNLYPGDTCAISLNCCMSSRPSEIKAIAEEDTEFIAIPVNVLDDWMTRYKSWKQFMLETYRVRYDELIHTIDSIAFSKMDERLERYLEEKSRATKSRIIKMTHQQIASELGSSREVISRLLKQMEKNGQVVLRRNEVELA